MNATLQGLATLAVTYVPLMSTTFASNVGKRSTLIDSVEKRDMLNCTEKCVLLVVVNCHGSPFQFLKRDSRSRRMSGSLLLSWEAFVIPFMTITQSRPASFFNAVPLAIDPP